MNSPDHSNSHQQNTLKPPLILAVDDNEDNLQLLTHLIGLLECAFITATDGETTLGMAQNYQPALILLDMMLPDISGIEVVHRLKKNLETRAIPIIAVTGMARTEDRARFISAGCIDYIKKPYIIDEMEVIILSYIRKVPAV